MHLNIKKVVVMHSDVLLLNISSCQTSLFRNMDSGREILNTGQQGRGEIHRKTVVQNQFKKNKIKINRADTL